MDVVAKFIHKFGRLPTETDPDYLEMLRMSKYQISDVPMYKPGRCANCGSSQNDGRRYVDFGLEVDWYGTVFLCGFCLKDVAEKMGLFTDYQERLESFSRENERLMSLQVTEQQLRTNALDAFKELKDYYVDVLALGNHIPFNTPASVDSTPASEVTPEPASEPVIDTPKPRATKSTPSARRTHVPSLADLLNADEPK